MQGCDVTGGRVSIAVSNWQQVLSGNWQIWVQYCGSEMVSIHMVRDGTVGFSNVKALNIGDGSLGS